MGVPGREYALAHKTVREQHGPASDYTCVDCGETASEWSYSGEAINELTADDGRAFSKDPDDYVPRCRFCHVHFDGNWIGNVSDRHKTHDKSPAFDVDGNLKMASARDWWEKQAWAESH